MTRWELMIKFDVEGRDGSLEKELQTVQALALLALAECGTLGGRGQNGLAWMYSGLACRIFQHLSQRRQQAAGLSYGDLHGTLPPSYQSTGCPLSVNETDYISTQLNVIPTASRNGSGGLPSPSSDGRRSPGAPGAYGMPGAFPAEFMAKTVFGYPRRLQPYSSSSERLPTPRGWAQDEDLVYFVQVGFMVRQILRMTRGPGGALYSRHGNPTGSGAGPLTPTAVCLLSLVQGGHDTTRLHETMLMLYDRLPSHLRMFPSLDLLHYPDLVSSSQPTPLTLHINLLFLTGLALLHGPQASSTARIYRLPAPPSPLTNSAAHSPSDQRTDRHLTSADMIKCAHAGVYAIVKTMAEFGSRGGGGGGGYANDFPPHPSHAHQPPYNNNHHHRTSPTAPPHQPPSNAPPANEYFLSHPALAIYATHTITLPANIFPRASSMGRAVPSYDVLLACFERVGNVWPAARRVREELGRFLEGLESGGVGVGVGGSGGGGRGGGGMHIKREKAGSAEPEGVAWWDRVQSEAGGLMF
ncbi:hypothetical protein HDV00_011796 [Rhizophlyctis rosea]|nr:hypothetical protein HDV00_011796 [Rhizophlyctis rosea]